MKYSQYIGIDACGRISAPMGPVRTCVICRSRFPKERLERYVVSEGTSGARDMLLDDRKTMPGRGYYLCPQEDCRRRFLKFRGPRKSPKGVRHVG